jgi:hypothetical protein
MAAETAAGSHIGQQKTLGHLKCTGEHLSGTAWSKQEQQFAGTISFKHKTHERPFHTNKSQSKVCHWNQQYTWIPIDWIWHLPRHIMHSCLDTKTAANVHIRQQKTLGHLKYTGEHSSDTAWSKQEQQCTGTISFKHKTRDQLSHINKKSKQGVLLKPTIQMTPHSLNLTPV